MPPTAAPPPLPSRLQTLPREARDTLFLLAVVAWLVASQSAHLPLWTAGFAAAMLGWRAWLAWAGRPLPGRRVLGAALALAVAGTVASHGTVLGRDAGVTLVVVLLALKTLELRARRDALVIFFLGFFTMLTQFFFSQSLPAAMAMLAGLMGLLAALVNAHMPVGRPPLLLPLRTAGTMALLGAPVAVALFLLFPRVAPLWGTPADAVMGRTGLSPTMQVGTIATLAMNESIALRVRFDTPDGAPPPQQALYFRGPVLASFDGSTWRELPSDATPRLPTPAELEVRGAPVRYEATLEPSQRPWLLVLDAVRDMPALPAGTSARMNADLQWIASRPLGDVLRYRAESYLDFRHGPHGKTPRLDPYAALPPGSNPRTAALAGEIRARLGSGAGTQALVDAVWQRLRTGGYTYTLDPGVYGTQTADEFWFDRKEGFCEHIASSFVILLRAMGVPSRIVTGYQGGERNPVDGYWTIRQSDAHAWAEVWYEDRGWQRVDPTAAVSPGRVGAFERLRPAPGVFAAAVGAMVAPGFVTRLRAVWEAANNGWNQWVLNYTQGRQLDLLRALGIEAPGWEDLGYATAGLAVLTALGSAGWAWRGRRQDPWLRLLARARARLQRAGLAAPAATPRALARQVQALRGGEAGDAIAAWLLRLEAQRYAAHGTPAALAALRRDFRTLRWPPRAPAQPPASAPSSSSR
ncbi:transglutaminase family protein [Xylophilus sp.]|uniref:transglutaminase family protein n=1 Tax=Xylophilus sp. TaxID=2653893 RepID=UPI0013B5C2DF|nr:DUF3488 and transglutaminase-like domain-containing protein [Xylophilus sp.]KAF1045532.1 MAG: Protein-glutamine gamma-glutamyltransferase [Xylophilus sp.]